MAMSTNNFLENELRKIFGNDDIFSNTKYISGVCYGELDNELKVKCKIDDSGVRSNYDVLRIAVINRKDGVVDKHTIQFFDVWGKFPVPGNHNFKDGVAPHIWAYEGKPEWYAAVPKEKHYEILRDNVKNYLDIFRDKSMEQEQKPSIKKQLSDSAKTTPKKSTKNKQNDLEVQPMNEEKNTITVLVVEPMKEPYTKEIGSDYKAMQKEVGGSIQASYPYDDMVGIISNVESKNIGLPLNRAIYDEDKNMIDIIAGKFLVVGLGDENFTSLDADLIKKFSDKFRNPEQFFKLGNEIVAIPVKPSIKEQLKDDKTKTTDVPKAPAKNKNNDLEV